MEEEKEILEQNPMVEGEYDLPEDQTVSIEKEGDNLRVNFSDLDPLSKLRVAAASSGIEIQDPNKSCKKCWGRGYTGVETKTKLPVPCKCVFKKEDRQSMGVVPNRAMRRAEERRNRKKGK